MRLSKHLSLITLIGSLAFFAQSTPAEEPPIVKQSNSKICHTKESPFYAKTRNYIVFKTVEACLAAGGRLPKYMNSKTANVLQDSGKYNRDDWLHWLDKDGDCQDQRGEQLLLQSQIKVSFDTPSKCRVDTGKWLCPYSGKLFYDDDDLDIDHRVPLGYAHARGGASWPKHKKAMLANDPENLIAVDKRLNRQKGAAGPTEWMPPFHPRRCEYLEKFDYVMQKYELKYFQAEERIINRMKKACNL